MYKIIAFFSLVLCVLLLLVLAVPQITTHLQSPLTLKDPVVTSSNTTGQFIPEPVSLERIFADDHSWTATVAADRIRTMIATGDVLPARSVNVQVLKQKDFTWPYQKTADVVQSADVTFINLETPLLRDCPITNEGMVFCGDARHIEGLKFSGVDIASVANNHMGNHAVAGVDETEALLRAANIVSVGRSGPVIYPIRDMRFAFLAYNDISAPQTGFSATDEEVIKRDLAQAQQQADYVIVSYHWGTEYQSQPDERQKYLAHFLIDLGADLIIGNHPHWIQPVEFYKGKLITYAHGNYIFDQMWSQKTREGVVGRYTFYDSQLIDVEYVPIRIDDYGQATYPDAQSSRRMLEEMKKETAILQQNVKL